MRPTLTMYQSPASCPDVSADLKDSLPRVHDIHRQQRLLDLRLQVLRLRARQPMVWAMR